MQINDQNREFDEELYLVIQVHESLRLFTIKEIKNGINAFNVKNASYTTIKMLKQVPQKTITKLTYVLNPILRIN